MLRRAPCRSTPPAPRAVSAGDPSRRRGGVRIEIGNRGGAATVGPGPTPRGGGLIEHATPASRDGDSALASDRESLSPTRRQSHARWPLPSERLAFRDCVTPRLLSLDRRSYRPCRQGGDRRSPGQDKAVGPQPVARDRVRLNAVRTHRRQQRGDTSASVLLTMRGWWLLNDQDRVARASTERALRGTMGVRRTIPERSR